MFTMQINRKNSSNSSSMPGAPHDGGLVSRRNGNRISGPPSLHLDAGQTTAAVDQEKLDCPFFSCGHLQDIRYPFRLQGDPPGCGVRAYELVCSDNKTIIYINRGRYFVTNISYTESIFWVVDANLDDSSCPIPETNQHPYTYGLQSEDTIQLYPDATTWAAFVNCSQPVGIGSNVLSNPTTSFNVTYKSSP
ncbi:hypothetical protein EJB05_56060 [Eragrostis curvula]|uniref:Wall-associated receptor kinase galacturonan-binding domain-containing protein n=1 Tax=Eragrostis curvula TaxID=38414 RepID=A0A5J9SIU3_9POAL|nr:hypothetical protein EJB05_56060 [Eragrostis curvula]